MLKFQRFATKTSQFLCIFCNFNNILMFMIKAIYLLINYSGGGGEFQGAPPQALYETLIVNIDCIARQRYLLI